jgi:hypothetical protein
MGITPLELMKSTAGWQTIEAQLPEDFEALAKEHKVLQVQYGVDVAKITTASVLLRLILLHAGTNLGLRQSVALVAEGGGPAVSHVTLHKKMRLSASYLKALVGRLAAAGADGAPERWAGYELVIVDGSSFCGADGDGTDARLHLQLRLTDLEILSVRIEDRSVGESFKRFAWRKGQLALADRGYCNAPGIASVVEQGADVLVRVNRRSLPMFTPAGERVDVLAWLRTLKGYMPREQRVVVRSGDRCVQGRLIACRLSAAQAEKARAWIRRERGNKATAADLKAAHYVVLFTTAPAERMSMAMCLELYRLRWQVELAFKRWKSLCHFDHLPNRRDDTILTWLYAKMLLAMLMHRIASGASPLFPPVQNAEECNPMVFNAVEGRQHLVARDRRGAAAA